MSAEKQQVLNTLQIAKTEEGTSHTVEDLSLTSSLLDAELLLILKARFTEAQLCLPHSPMATIMLCGSLLEGLLFGLANTKPADFNRAPQAPKGNDGKPKPFKEWSLAQFIDVAYSLGVLREDVRGFSHILRNFRNYIHPHQQMKQDFHPERHTAELCLNVVKAAVNNLNAGTKSKAKDFFSDWAQHPDATYLALTTLIGSWNDSQCDLEVITELLNISRDQWRHKALDILHCSDSPLSVKNGTWQVVNRLELFILLGSRILDRNLVTFQLLAVSVLKGSAPSFGLLAERRYEAIIHDKELHCSRALRKGIAEGLAILGNQPKVCRNCSHRKVEQTCELAIRELLKDADWVLWGRLNELLPTLAEAEPCQFLRAVEQAMCSTPCPFYELLKQERREHKDHLMGLRWALEVLAWDEAYLVQACVALAGLASHVSSDDRYNPSLNSLVEILLPWRPQTLASVEKRRVAAQTVLRERPDVGWDLLIQLLPDQKIVSNGTRKPIWRNPIPNNYSGKVTREEYLHQVRGYWELAVVAAGQDVERLSKLIGLCVRLPDDACEQLLEKLETDPVLKLPEAQRLLIWDHLTRLKHRLDKGASRNELIKRIDDIIEQFSSSDPFYSSQCLFSGDGHYIYQESGDVKERQEQLFAEREKAVLEIIQRHGVQGVIQFAESVSLPFWVGVAVGAIAEDRFKRVLLPGFLDSVDEGHQDLVAGFIGKSRYDKGWEWCDELDKTAWTPQQVGQFLAFLPFTKDAWDRASEWLQSDVNEYWSRVSVALGHKQGDLGIAIDKFIKYGRPHEAIKCLNWMRTYDQPIDICQCIKALNAALHSNEPSKNRYGYDILGLIKFLQLDSSVSKDDLLRIEWGYLPLLRNYEGFSPIFLESRLAGDPDFFCELIAMIAPPKEEGRPLTEITEELRALKGNAFNLLDSWRIPPGTQADGTFSGKRFAEWLQRVKQVCGESGNLALAFSEIGKVLVCAPPDQDGLWIDHAVAVELNDQEADKMRNGYFRGRLAARGMYSIDPTGKPEKELAEQFRREAKDVENSGFHRFAVTLRDLAEYYEREAESVVLEHQQEAEP